ncbi:hypothetical protein DKG71_01020 [Streptomyces sp. NEAU-S7GS2]|nr:hypothetical protein DKG71_01020 [Streptomyces sp. NEAU-S7GS2]
MAVRWRSRSGLCGSGSGSRGRDVGSGGCPVAGAGWGVEARRGLRGRLARRDGGDRAGPVAWKYRTGCPRHDLPHPCSPCSKAESRSTTMPEPDTAPL